jgi:transcriptional regulator with PAS, ATPase and Fis domain
METPMTMHRSERIATEIIGNSAAILAVKKFLMCIVKRDASVLVEGETGTGKEITARAVHYASSRSAGQFIPVNCGAIPDALLESELFGHCQGAFTDAKRSSPGILLLANGGTLFLDEVDALSARAQVALLRFLQERTIRALGASKECKVDVRVIAASNRSLERLVERGQFRQDLFYRLNVMYVELPPLRCRGDDVQLFADHFLAQMRDRYGGSAMTLDTQSREWLAAQAWPGNIRELENLIEREFLVHDGQPVLRLSVLDRCADPIETARASSNRWNYRDAKERVLEEFNRAFLDGLMRSVGGNVTLAARTSGKERRELGRLLRRYGIAAEAFRQPRLH